MLANGARSRAARQLRMRRVQLRGGERRRISGILHGFSNLGRVSSLAATDLVLGPLCRQTQHCYCNLCRRLSGSVAETWVPVRPDGWRWTSQRALELVRTTNHGSRHMCTVCGTTLTIVYDSQPECLWPVAGVLDDDSLPPPQQLGSALCRSIHICCSMMQPWYKLPDDELPRLKYAG